jgi:hypothetical protein
MAWLLDDSADGRNVYEVLRDASRCWPSFAAGRPVPGCGCRHHAFEGGAPVTVGGVNVPARFRRFGRGVAVTVYPDGRMEPAILRAAGPR